MAFTAGLCDRLQQSLINIAQENSSALKRDKVGFVDSLVSMENTMGYEQVQTDQGNGKNHGVRVKYFPRAIESEVVTAPFDVCAATNETEPLEVTVDADQFVGITRMFTRSEIDKLCEGRDEWVAGVTQSLFNSVLVKLDKQLVTLQSANFGEFADNTTNKSVQLLKADGSADYAGEAAMMQEYDLISGTGTPIVVGHNKLDLYRRIVGVGCCNDSGIDLSQAGQFAYFSDRYVSPILGADEFLMYAPGSVQLISYNANRGTNMVMSPNNYEHSIITDVTTGIDFDFDMVYDECAKKWRIGIGLYYNLFNLPTDQFKAGDELEGVNYTLNFTATQAV